MVSGVKHAPERIVSLLRQVEVTPVKAAGFRQT